MNNHIKTFVARKLSSHENIARIYSSHESIRRMKSFLAAGVAHCC